MQTTAGPPPAPKHTFPESLATVTIRPGDRDYDDVRHTYTRLGSPAAVIRVRDHQDIADTLAHARTTGVPVTARSGGHGISGRSTNDQGMVIDLSRLNTVEILDSRSGLVRVEAGARWGDVAAALAPHGLGLSSGDTGDVGVGGLATAGGIGLMSRLHGLTIDHMSAAELVLAHGSLIRTDPEHRPDLFWAVRGAGTNFGVATAFEFQAQPVRDVIVAMTVYDAADTAAFLTRWAAAVEAAPRSLTSFLTLVAGPDGRAAVAQAMTVYAGTDATQARAALAPLLSAGPVLRNHATVAPYHRLLPAGHEPQHAQQPLTVSRSGLLDHITPPAAESMAALLTSPPAEAGGFFPRGLSFLLLRQQLPRTNGKGRWYAQQSYASSTDLTSRQPGGRPGQLGYRWPDSLQTTSLLRVVGGGRRSALAANRLSLPCSTGVRFLPRLKAGVSTEESR
ncbi:FAD-binding oxidoreductase [Streptomyces mirabilis]|uniref:FAD-binding oxidoreductase n=2 Tax=Streptomyces mirabilis TaxID=68239 RepID=UPI00366827B3